MITVQLLGGASLRSQDGPLVGPPAQRHRIALLTLIVATWPQPLARDRALALLWPEKDTASARRLLNLSVHVLRTALGDDAIASSGDGLLLDPARIVCDLHDLRAAIAAGDVSASSDSTPVRCSTVSISTSPPSSATGSTSTAPSSRTRTSARCSRSRSVRNSAGDVHGARRHLSQARRRRSSFGHVRLRADARARRRRRPRRRAPARARAREPGARRSRSRAGCRGRRARRAASPAPKRVSIPVATPRPDGRVRRRAPFPQSHVRSRQRLSSPTGSRKTSSPSSRRSTGSR